MEDGGNERNGLRSTMRRVEMRAAGGTERRGSRYSRSLPSDSLNFSTKNHYFFIHQQQQQQQPWRRQNQRKPPLRCTTSKQNTHPLVLGGFHSLTVAELNAGLIGTNSYLTPDKDVWSKNAWDHVPPPADQGERIAASLARQRAKPVPDTDKTQYNTKPAKYWLVTSSHIQLLH